jgi:hypothetical protein
MLPNLHKIAKSMQIRQTSKLSNDETLSTHYEVITFANKYSHAFVGVAHICLVYVLLYSIANRTFKIWHKYLA